MLISPKLKYRVLTVGFESNILFELRRCFDVRFVIAQDPSSDLAWDELHLMKVDVPAPVLTKEMLRCLNFLKQYYVKFSDINSRRFYYVTASDSETYNAFVLTFFACYGVIKDNKINLCLFANIPHEGFDYLIYLIAQFLKIKTVMCYQSLFSNRFWVTQKIENFCLFNNFSKLYPLEPSNYKLPQNWFYMQGSNKDSAYNLRQTIVEILKKPYRFPLALVRYAYAYRFRQSIKKFTNEPVAGERYIYFPLHLQPELTTSALGGEYSDQMLAIETLSAFVPNDCCIYLKENPKQTEKQRDRFFYKRLSSLKNVKLLSQKESSIILIKNSIGVATITGTAGWEALFYGKPVLIFGLAWYRDFHGVTQYKADLKFEDFICTLPENPELLVNELDILLQNAGKGVVDSAYQCLVENFKEHENAKFVSESLIKYIELN